jgi:hypothetical protein
VAEASVGNSWQAHTAAGAGPEPVPAVAVGSAKPEPGEREHNVITPRS